MIVGLTLIVILVGFGWWGIRPALKKASEADKEYEKQSSIRDMNDLKLSQLPMLTVSEADYEAQMAEEKKNFYPMMRTSEIDRLFTDMALSHNLNAYDLSIDVDKAPTEVKPYQYSAMAYEVQNAENESVSAEDLETDAEGLTDPFAYVPSIAFNSEIYGVNIGMRLSGEREQLQAMIDELSNSEKRILVRNFIWSEQMSVDESALSTEGSEDGAPAYAMKVTSVLRINLTLYMCNADETEDAGTEAGGEE